MAYHLVDRELPFAEIALTTPWACRELKAHAEHHLCRVSLPVAVALSVSSAITVVVDGATWTASSVDGRIDAGLHRVADAPPVPDGVRLDFDFDARFLGDRVLDDGVARRIEAVVQELLPGTRLAVAP